jgi:hypothetical protein
MIAAEVEIAIEATAIDVAMSSDVSRSSRAVSASMTGSGRRDRLDDCGQQLLRRCLAGWLVPDIGHAGDLA